MNLSQRSEKALAFVQADLVRVARRAAEITHIPFIITEGLRTEERQRQLVAAGASRTMNSKHLTGHAIDIAAVIDGEVRWDWPLYSQLAAVFKEAAELEGVAITWGGDWRKFRDGPHYELKER